MTNNPCPGPYLSKLLAFYTHTKLVSIACDEHLRKTKNFNLLSFSWNKKAKGKINSNKWSEHEMFYHLCKPCIMLRIKSDKKNNPYFHRTAIVEK